MHIVTSIWIHSLRLVLSRLHTGHTDGDVEGWLLNAVVVLTFRNIIGSTSTAVMIPVWRAKMFCRVIYPLNTVLISYSLSQTI